MKCCKCGKDITLLDPSNTSVKLTDGYSLNRLFTLCCRCGTKLLDEFIKNEKKLKENAKIFYEKLGFEEQEETRMIWRRKL